MKKIYLFLNIAIIVLLAIPPVGWADEVKITELPAVTSIAGTDLIYVVINPGSTPVSKKITAAEFLKALLGVPGGNSYLLNSSTAGVLGYTNPAAFQAVSGLRISWQSVPDDTHYPSEKLVKDSLDAKQAALTYPVTGVASPSAGYLVKWDTSGNKIVDALKFGTMTDTYVCEYSTANGLVCNTNPTTFQVVSALRASWQSTPDDTHYPSEKLVKDSLDAKQAVSGLRASWQVTPDDVHYPSEKLVKDSLDAKQVSALRTTWQATPDDTHYPSEKLVKDNLDAKQTSALRTTWQVTPDDTHYPSEKLVMDSLNAKQATLTYPVTGVASPTAGYLVKWGASGNAIVDGFKFGTMTDAKYCTWSDTSGLTCTSSGGGGGGGGNVYNYGTPANHQWGVWIDATDIKGVAVTASKVVCSNYDGDPVACTNLTDVTYQPTSALRTSFQATPDDTHYPSEKLVKDSLDAKQTAAIRTSWQVTPDDVHYPSEKLVKDSLNAKQNTLTYPVTGPASPVTNGLVKFTGTEYGTDNAGVILGTMTDGYYCKYASSGTLLSCNTVLGTAAALNVGTSASQVVQLDGSAKLPAVDGSLLTNLPSSSALPTGWITGLGLTNNSGDVNTYIGIAAGKARDSTDAADIIIASDLVKHMGATWVAGTGNGGSCNGTALPASGTWHVFAISKAAGANPDVCGDTSLTPTLPTNYTVKRLIGSFRTDSSAYILNGTWWGNGINRTFMFNSPILDVDSTNPGTSAVTATLSVPTGIIVKSLLNSSLDAETSGKVSLYISSLNNTNLAASYTAAPLGTVIVYTATQGSQAFIFTNTSGQIRLRLSISGASDVVRIATLGWEQSL